MKKVPMVMMMAGGGDRKAKKRKLNFGHVKKDNTQSKNTERNFKLVFLSSSPEQYIFRDFRRLRLEDETTAQGGSGKEG